MKIPGPSLADLINNSKRFTSPQHQASTYAGIVLKAARDAGRVYASPIGPVAAVRADVARSLFDKGCRVRIQAAGQPIPSRAILHDRSSTLFDAVLQTAITRAGRGARLVYFIPVCDLEVCQ